MTKVIKAVEQTRIIKAEQVTRVLKLSGALPNLPENSVWIGNASLQPIALATGATRRDLLQDATPADARTTLGLGTAATTDAADYATAAQGSKADTATQPLDDISTL